MSTLTQVTTWYLEQTAAGQLRPARVPEAAAGVTVVRAEVPSPEFGRYLYTTVGADVSWTDRLGWDRARWLAWVDRPELETWVAYEHGTPAGFVDLQTVDGVVEITSFGLLPAFRGRLSEEEVKTILEYIKTVWTQEQREAQRREDEEDDRELCQSYVPVGAIEVVNDPGGEEADDQEKREERVREVVKRPGQGRSSPQREGAVHLGRSVRRDAHTGPAPWNPIYGMGKLDIVAALRA
jgi:hypothetical protein